MSLDSWQGGIMITQTEASTASSDDFALCVIKMYKLGGETGTFARPMAMETQQNFLLPPEQCLCC